MPVLNPDMIVSRLNSTNRLLNFLGILFNIILQSSGTFNYRLSMSSAPGSSVGIATDYWLDGPGIESRWARFSARPDRPWGPPNLLYNGYWVFPGGKVRPERAADSSPLSSAVVMEE